MTWSAPRSAAFLWFGLVHPPVVLQEEKEIKLRRVPAKPIQVDKDAPESVEAKSLGQKQRKFSSSCGCGVPACPLLRGWGCMLFLLVSSQFQTIFEHW